MKALFINGSPRKGWCTHRLLQQAIAGAQEAGAQTKLFHLYDESFKGCVSCFACKRKERKNGFLCAYRDALTPLLEEAQTADCIVVGSPVYLHSMTGLTKAFLERLLYPIVTYMSDGKGGRKLILGRTVQTGLIYTMNQRQERLRDPDVQYDIILGKIGAVMAREYGYNEILYACDTFQFDDYEKYDSDYFDPAHKKSVRDEQFPKDLNQAFLMGKRLVQRA